MAATDDLEATCRRLRAEVADARLALELRARRAATPRGFWHGFAAGAVLGVPLAGAIVLLLTFLVLYPPGGG